MEQDSKLKTQEQEAVNRFAKCVSILRETLDSNKFIAEYPEAKEVLFSKYCGLAKALCQGATIYNEEIVVKFIRVINHEIE